MTESSKETENLQGVDKSHLWHPFTQMSEWVETTPLIIERGEGSYLIDTDGNRYLDGVSSLWVTVHGHGKKELNDAIKEQVDRISHSTLLGLGNVPAIELAEELCKITPSGLERVFYSDAGATAVEIGLKMAFQYCSLTGREGKRKFLSFTGAYHGDTIGAMSVGELDTFVSPFAPLTFEGYRAPYPYCYRCPVEGNKKRHPECGTECLDLLEGILKEHSDEIAACIIEPLVQGAAGIVTSPPGFLKGVADLAKANGVLLIADEVATGFGRTGSMFACEEEGVEPDILCIAKGLTGGYLPLAATITTEEIYEAFLGPYEDFTAFLHGHTYTGNPLGASAALANLKIFRDEDTLEKLPHKVDFLRRLLLNYKVLSQVGEVRQKGLMVGIELVKDRSTKERYSPGERVGHRVCMAARGRGAILRPLGDVIVLMPPLSISELELQRLLKVTYDSIREVTE